MTLMPAWAWGATYYLDANVVGGNDDGSSWANAWDTLAEAQAIATSGDTVYVKDGNYGAFVDSTSERADWITYKADTGHTPEFTRIYLIGDWADSYLSFDGITIRDDIDEGYDAAITLYKKRHIKLLNLNIVGAGYLLSGLSGHMGILIDEGGEDITIDTCNIYGDGEGYLSGFSCGVFIEEGVDVVLENSEISEVSLGVYAEGTRITISDNNIHKLSADGIVFMDVTDLIIEDNEIHDLVTYIPTLNETVTDTTWNDAGTIMTNAGAAWNTPGDTLITQQMEVVATAGTNVLLGDGEEYGGNFAISTVSEDGHQITLSKGMAIRELSYTSGGTYTPAKGHTITGEISGATAIVYSVTVDSGSWAGGDAAGTLQIRSQTETFQEETVKIGTNLDVASISGNSSAVAPSNVSYYIKSQVHTDLIQANVPVVGDYNVTIRRNKLYDCIDALAFMHINPIGGARGNNFIVENNLFWNVYESGAELNLHPVRLQAINGLLCRNNTIFGRLQIKLNEANTVTLENNIVATIDVTDDTHGILKSDYNILNEGFWDSTATLGGHDITIGTLAGEWLIGSSWNNSAFTSIFADYANGDFRPASSESLAVGHGDPTNYPINDITGVIRGYKENSDTGCYEWLCAACK